jgi:hypothetical protein
MLRLIPAHAGYAGLQVICRMHAGYVGATEDMQGCPSRLFVW